ncbi:MAG: GNAT family N-acetyltransferase [Phycisphaeraceae bacterium]|nr:GNAT family N-acetyltransferase [Phycisphaeraceae bacterium]
MHDALRTATESDVPALVRLGTLAFGHEAESALAYHGLVGLSNIRVTDGPDGAPVAMLAEIPMGVRAGGSSVPAVGIAAVAVAPEARGGGCARRLMTACVRDLHARRVPVSALYASTLGLYRGVGYERSIASYAASIRFDDLPRSRGSDTGRRPWIPLSAAEEHGVAACYDAFARNLPGMVDRGAFFWSRIRRRMATEYRGFGLPSGDGASLEAYVFLAHRQSGSGVEMVISDCAFRSAVAGRALVDFLAGFATINTTAYLSLAPNHPLVRILPHERVEIKARSAVMLRLTHVEAALAARAIPVAVRGAVRIAFEDPTIPAQGTLLHVDMTDGRMKVQRAADTDRAALPHLHTGPRGLAAVYTGFVSPRQAQADGLMDGDGEALDLLGAALAGPPPFMTDMF